MTKLYLNTAIKKFLKANFVIWIPDNKTISFNDFIDNFLAKNTVNAFVHRQCMKITVTLLCHFGNLLRKTIQFNTMLQSQRQDCTALAIRPNPLISSC